MSEQIKKLYTDAGLTPPKGKGIHTEAFHRCVVSVMKKGGADDPHAICMAQLGRDKSVKKAHRSSTYRLKNGRKVRL
jgi:hypothetical protein